MRQKSTTVDARPRARGGARRARGGPGPRPRAAAPGSGRAAGAHSLFYLSTTTESSAVDWSTVKWIRKKQIEIGTRARRGPPAARSYTTYLHISYSK